MTLNFESIVLLITVVLTGLSAGLCFTWTNAVTPGLGRLDDLGYLQAFQAMNRSILNPLFFVVFLGPFFTHILNGYMARGATPEYSGSLLIPIVAAILYIGGLVFVTIFKNVPLNEILDKTDLLTASAEELAQLRQKFEGPWRSWHLVRTICSTLAFVLLVLQIFLTNQPS